MLERQARHLLSPGKLEAWMGPDVLEKDACQARGQRITGNEGSLWLTVNLLISSLLSILYRLKSHSCSSIVPVMAFYAKADCFLACFSQESAKTQSVLLMRWPLIAFWNAL